MGLEAFLSSLGMMIKFMCQLDWPWDKGKENEKWNKLQILAMTM